MRYLLLLTVALAASAQTARPPTYDDDVKPIFRRRCFGCHSSAESRAGLSLETYAGVLKGGGSGDIVIAGRPAASLLYKVVATKATASLACRSTRPRFPTARSP
jgi:Planctomycete cytochrome C.